MREWGTGGGRRYEFSLVNHEDAGICFKVDAGAFLDDLESGNGDVFFVGEAEADEVEHGCLALLCILLEYIRGVVGFEGCYGSGGLTCGGGVNGGGISLHEALERLVRALASVTSDRL